MANVKQRNWNPDVFQRLTQLIEEYGGDQVCPPKQRPYVVFDFDDTTIIHNVQKTILIYMMHTLTYKLTPKQFYALFMAKPPYRSAEQIYLLIEDIIENYQWLYDHYINEETRDMTLDEVRQKPYFLNFRAKLYYFHTIAKDYYNRRAGEPWLTYWFVNYKRDEFKDYCQEAFQAMTQVPFKHHLFATTNPGKYGHVSVSFNSSLAFVPEMKELYRELDERGFEIYIVSASPIDIVKNAAAYGNYPVPETNIFAMQYDYDSENRITARMSDDKVISSGEGKTEIIQRYIKPRHEYRDPVMVFGDSMGDYEMLTALDGVEVSVLFNRHFGDDTKRIVECALENKNEKDARYVIQGRNEPAGTLHPSAHSILLNE
ncbi:haloacid dehalogenase-like hydrolase [Aerococcaceae bacterium DSM 111020]|nr:haloacid dehalogenase-like hydrolase [Aerococcaceae bacterium DSM 111020]